EIENRVIYTVVTKPTTRLEIVLGKVVGFARVSLAILVIMGIFSYGYLAVRAWNMQRYIGDRLESSNLPAPMAATLAEYQKTGLLTARTLEKPDDLQIFAHLPEDSSSRRYVASGGEGSFLIPFKLSKEDLIPPGAPDSVPGSGGAMIFLHIGYRTLNDARAAAASPKPATTRAGTPPYWGPFIVSPEERQRIMASVKPLPPPSI